MLRFAPQMMAVFLSASMLAGCASAMPDVAKMTGGDTASGHAKKEVAAATVDKTTPTDLEGGIRQAQLMRYAGQYDDAIHVLSQLMLVASDDPRVVSEYGKTLAEKGRAQDAVEFLNRAIELSPNDWTLYSALGVSYDQLGNQTAARTAYEHALALRPDEPSVLNNYALSRMLAGDPEGARVLIGRAQAAGGASDSKIAANIALLNKVATAPQADVAQVQKPAPIAPVNTTPHPAPVKPRRTLPAFQARARCPECAADRTDRSAPSDHQFAAGGAAAAKGCTGYHRIGDTQRRGDAGRSFRSVCRPGQGPGICRPGQRSRQPDCASRQNRRRAQAGQYQPSRCGRHQNRRDQSGRHQASHRQGGQRQTGWRHQDR